MKSYALLLSLLYLFISSAEAGTLSTVGQDRWVKVTRIVDGDTFRTAAGEKIRLLGINTPEIAHGTKPGEKGGVAAKEALSELIQGKLVRLKFDQDRRDKYERLLAQVYLRDGLWINGELVRKGYAHVYTFLPNLRWADALLREESKARRDKRGIWSSKRFRVLSSKRVKRSHIGQFRLVTGKIITKKNAYSWELEGGLKISVPRKAKASFGRSNHLRKSVRVLVRGKVRALNSGGVALSIYTPADIEVLQGFAE